LGGEFYAVYRAFAGKLFALSNFFDGIAESIEVINSTDENWRWGWFCYGDYLFI